MARKSFSIHSDYYGSLMKLSDEQRGKLLLALTQWANDDEIVELDVASDILFDLMIAQIERISNANSANGAKGGRPSVNESKKSEAEYTESEKSEDKSKKSEVKPKKPSVTVTDTVTDTVTNTKDEKTKDEGTLAAKASAPLPIAEVVDSYNAICVSLPRVTTISDARAKAIKTRLKQYNVDEFRRIFQKAEASSFLKGKNERNWSANFDWLLKDSNMAKVLDGNYDDRASPGYNPESVYPSYEEAKEKGWTL